MDEMVSLPVKTIYHAMTVLPSGTMIEQMLVVESKDALSIWVTSPIDMSCDMIKYSLETDSMGSYLAFPGDDSCGNKLTAEIEKATKIKFTADAPTVSDDMSEITFGASPVPVVFKKMGKSKMARLSEEMKSLPVKTIYHAMTELPSGTMIEQILIVESKDSYSVWITSPINMSCDMIKYTLGTDSMGSVFAPTADSCNKKLIKELEKATGIEFTSNKGTVSDDMSEITFAATFAASPVPVVFKKMGETKMA